LWASYADFGRGGTGSPRAVGTAPKGRLGAGHLYRHRRLRADRSADCLASSAFHRECPRDPDRPCHRPPELARRLRFHQRQGRRHARGVRARTTGSPRSGRSRSRAIFSSVIRASNNSFRVRPPRPEWRAAARNTQQHATPIIFELLKPPSVRQPVPISAVDCFHDAPAAANGKTRLRAKSLKSWRARDDSNIRPLPSEKSARRI
jgi:hypothetical protein